jgi:hypothetical protein
MMSLEDLVERSEFDRDSEGLWLVADDLGLLLVLSKLPKKEPPPRKPGLPGEVAMGSKNGSMAGFVIAVCNAVKNRRGPAGLRIIITSGMRTEDPE